MTFDFATFFGLLWPPTVIEQYPMIYHGLGWTIVLSVMAEIIGVVLGFVLALMVSSRNLAARWFANGYIQYFRGTPLIVQLTLIYFGLSALGIYTFPAWTVFGVPISGAAQAGILGLALNEAAYMAEIVRSSLMSVDRGQHEAAKSIGMTSSLAFRRIILPQAFRIMLPTLGNNFNMMMKSTSLVVTIGGFELFRAFQIVNASTFKPFETFLAVSVYYLVLTLLWGQVQKYIERRTDYLK